MYKPAQCNQRAHLHDKKKKECIISCQAPLSWRVTDPFTERTKALGQHHQTAEPDLSNWPPAMNFQFSLFQRSCPHIHMSPLVHVHYTAKSKRCHIQQGKPLPWRCTWFTSDEVGYIKNEFQDQSLLAEQCPEHHIAACSLSSSHSASCCHIFPK